MMIRASRDFAARSLLAVALGLSVALLTACASTKEVDRLDADNTVQDRRIQALEQSTPQAIQEMADQLKIELVKINDLTRSLSGRASTQRSRSEKVAAEQVQLADTVERLQALVQRLSRRVDQDLKAASTRGLEIEKALDGIRGQLTGLEGVMQTRLAKLPSKTKADKAYREAYYQMINGQLDAAVGAFASFRTNHPKDPRAVDALYRQGQAYFLMRQYDSALIPCLELVDKYPRHSLAVDAKWMLARSLEETGDLKLAREFYTQLIAENTVHKTDATRRLYFIDRLDPKAGKAPRSNK